MWYNDDDDNNKWSKNVDEGCIKRGGQVFMGEERCKVTSTSRQHCNSQQQWHCYAVSDFLQRTTQQWLPLVDVNTWFFRPIRVTHPNSILIDSAVICQGSWTRPTHIHRHTDRLRDHATPSVATGRILRIECMWCGLIIIIVVVVVIRSIYLESKYERSMIVWQSAVWVGFTLKNLSANLPKVFTFLLFDRKSFSIYPL